MDLLAEKVAARFASEIDEEESDYDKLRKHLDEHMKPFKKGHAWWLPPHNLAVNTAIMEVNCWYFSIIPAFTKAVQVPYDGQGPSTLVIDPSWLPFQERFSHTKNTAELAVKLAKQQPTVPDSVKGDLAKIEEMYKIEIPAHIKSKLVGESLKVAERRWGVDRLRRKKIEIPLV